MCMRERVSSTFARFYFNQIQNMSESVLHTTDATFDQDTASGITVVDFWAVWCGPCQMMLPRLETLAANMDPRGVRVYKMNVDENPQTPQRFRVMSIPTIVILKDGKPVEISIGVQSVEDLTRLIDKHAGANDNQAPNAGTMAA